MLYNTVFVCRRRNVKTFCSTAFMLDRTGPVWLFSVCGHQIADSTHNKSRAHVVLTVLHVWNKGRHQSFLSKCRFITRTDCVALCTCLGHCVTLFVQWCTDVPSRVFVSSFRRSGPRRQHSFRQQWVRRG